MNVSARWQTWRQYRQESSLSRQPAAVPSAVTNNAEARHRSHWPWRPEGSSVSTEHAALPARCSCLRDQSTTEWSLVCDRCIEKPWNKKCEWVNEWILNGTSAQLGYTVPFTLVHDGKYRTEDKLKIQTIEKLNTTYKNKQYKIQQNKTTLDQSPFTTLGQETRWAYSTTIPQVTVTGSCLQRWLTYAVIGWLTKPRTAADRFNTRHPTVLCSTPKNRSSWSTIVAGK